MNGVALRTVREVRNKLFEKLQELSLDFYARKRTGELMSRIISDVEYINNAVSFAFKDLIHESLRLVIYAVLVISIGGKVSIVTLILFLMYFSERRLIPIWKSTIGLKKLRSSGIQKTM